ncbi:MAG: hypothetical protein RIQ93_127 [Verrucomicrobiota bacterium]|jgi:hypothetical protein
MRLIPFLLSCLLFASALPQAASAAAGGATSIRAILFVASNDRGAPDPKLRSYEPVLRSNLRFESYRYMGEGSAAVAPGGSASISLAGGNHVELERDSAGGPAKVKRGGAVVAVSPGKPVVLLGGPAGSKGEVYGIIVWSN